VQKLQPRAVIKKIWSPVHTLTLGTFLSQLIVFSSTLVMGQIYSPRQFGIYALVVSIAGVTAIFLTKSFETFLVPAESDEECELIFLDSLRLVVKKWLYILALIVTGYTVCLSLDLNVPRILNLFTLSLGLALLFGFYNLTYQLVLRKSKYKVLATRGPLQNSSIGVSQWILHFSFLQNFGLVFGEIVGRLIGLGFLVSNVKSTLAKIPRRIWNEPNKEKIRLPVAINFLSIIFDMLAAASLIILINWFFGNWAGGQVSMAQRMVVLPIVFLGTSFAQYYLSSYSSKRRDGHNLDRSDFDLILVKLILIAVFFAIFLFFAGALLVDIFLGSEWDTAGALIKYLLPMMVISFVWNPMSSFYYVSGLWAEFLKVSIIRLISISLSAFLGKYLELNLYEFTILLTSSSAVIQVYGLFTLRRTFPT
jgi:O-antigen/teichoic acid export membrane protein